MYKPIIKGGSLQSGTTCFNQYLFLVLCYNVNVNRESYRLFRNLFFSNKANY